jgi:hypothetical protein
MSSCEFQFNAVARFSADNLNSLSARFLSSLASRISFEYLYFKLRCRLSSSDGSSILNACSQASISVTQHCSRKHHLQTQDYLVRVFVPEARVTVDATQDPTASLGPPSMTKSVASRKVTQPRRRQGARKIRGPRNVARRRLSSRRPNR